MSTEKGLSERRAEDRERLRAADAEIAAAAAALKAAQERKQMILNGIAARGRGYMGGG